MKQRSLVSKSSWMVSAAGKKRKKSREELNAEGRERKRQKKHRGHAAGARHSPSSQQHSAGRNRSVADQRIGSKTPIPLTSSIEERLTPPVATVEAVLPAWQELEQLEQDPRLDSLLLRLEQGESLNDEEQGYVDRMLDRIDNLMVQLGISLEEDEEETAQVEQKSDIMRLLRD